MRVAATRTRKKYADDLPSNAPRAPPARLCRLRLYDGTRPEHPLLLAIKGRVLDVREGADYYGPDGPYKVMAGRDASKAFAMMSLKEDDATCDLTGVPDNHLKILDDWCARPRGCHMRRRARSAAAAPAMAR